MPYSLAVDSIIDIILSSDVFLQILLNGAISDTVDRFVKENCGGKK